MRVSAADLERYTYCPLSWWLNRQGVKGEGRALRKGVREHAAKGARLREWQDRLRAHREALRTSLHLALVAAAGTLLALHVTSLDWHGVGNRVILILSLLWLLVSLAFLARALRMQREARAARVSANLVDGDVTYSDLDRPGDVLESEKYDLGGKPDYVVRREGRLVPVEVKTGPTPPRPYDSHVLQVAAYCVLVEESLGERPPYGILSYSDKQYEIPFTEELKDRVLETILRMRLAALTGNVHREHAQPGRCRNCSRRSACGERLV